MIATSDIDEHMSILREVFAIIYQHKLTLKLSKCKFFVNEVDYLGYRVNSEGILPNPQKLGSSARIIFSFSI